MDADHLEQWILDLHMANVRCLREAGIQGSKDDVDDYADTVWDFAVAAGIEIADGVDPWFDMRRKERPPHG